ncbi:SEL1-like repeat protein [Legionella hackeliae]|uniref:Dot/Icm secretion system substrate n=1 Tax=Legionella hackeliae TaxID=449 RepID=A0A0A8UWE9_LEGHA|nr:hypothetical protein [Legionella hackeliae]KTD12463.1 hypothetical protein Lhac_1334 [Legionella hackeliae]CEK11876.1 protein of unknown function [Legionella hackeliae]STX48642.1 Uncharacterised protein [Legionella hackeliae]
MANYLNELASTQVYEDYQTRTDRVNMLKQFKASALAGSAVAAYRLAKNYPQNSESFLKWMKVAINQNLTNAMLDMALILVEQGSVAGVQKAAGYLVQILRSNDSYVKTLAEDFLHNNHLLSAEVSRQMKGFTAGLSLAGFFACDNKSIRQPVSDTNNSIGIS